MERAPLCGSELSIRRGMQAAAQQPLLGSFYIETLLGNLSLSQSPKLIS